MAAVASDWRKPPSFFRSFFRTDTSTSRMIDIMVQRGLEKIATDVIRGTEGNRNTWKTATMKEFDPPYFREYFDVTELECYDAFFTGAPVTPARFARFIKEAAQKVEALKDKIRRTYELQCSQVLHDGVVQFNKGIDIDFKRQTASKRVVGAGNWWTEAAIDPETILQEGLEFIRGQGKSPDYRFNVICGDQAFAGYRNNTAVKARNQQFNSNTQFLNPAQANAAGGVAHGWTSCGSYILDWWTYPSTYDDDSGNQVKFMDPKSIIIVPHNPDFVMAHAAVPQLIGANGAAQLFQGEFMTSHHIDEWNAQEMFDVKSVGLAVPVLVDQIFTAQVIS